MDAKMACGPDATVKEKVYRAEIEIGFENCESGMSKWTQCSGSDNAFAARNRTIAARDGAFKILPTEEIVPEFCQHRIRRSCRHVAEAARSAAAVSAAVSIGATSAFAVVTNVSCRAFFSCIMDAKQVFIRCFEKKKEELLQFIYAF